jgi:flagellin
MEVNGITGYDSASYSILRRIGESRRAGLASMGRLASGMKLNTAAESPSGMAMSERLRSLIGRYDAAIGNAENARNYLETSDGFMQTMQNTVGRMQELAISANDGTKSDADRALLSMEFEELKSSISDITSGSSPSGSFNGTALFQGQDIQAAVGPEHGEMMSFQGIDLTNSSSQVVGTDGSGNNVAWSSVLAPASSGGVGIEAQSGAAAGISALQGAVDFLSERRAVRGAEMERVNALVGGLREAQVNSVMAESGIRDTDMAAEMVNFSRYQALSGAGYAVLSRHVSGNTLATA